MAAPKPHPPTPQASLDSTLARLRDHASEFAALSVPARVALLRDLLERTVGTAEAQVEAACRAKDIPPGSPAEAEEWLGGPVLQARCTRLLAETLGDIARLGEPAVDWSKAYVRRDGRLALPVFPASRLDKLVFAGFTADVWFAQGLDVDKARSSQASFYKEGPTEGGVSLVLGAGNVASIGPLDVLHRMFTDGRVVVLKMNPVNEYLGEFIERQFAAFIERGFLAVVYGGAAVGAYLTGHPLVDDVHITGSDQTHDAIVWGPPGPERERRKQRGEPLLTKPISSELGNVSPILITPGPYTDRELDSMAHNLAAMVVNNASFNCNAAKLLVTAKGWSLRDPLLARLGEVLARTPTRVAYYPGAMDRYRKLTDGREGLLTFGAAPDGVLPWTLMPGLDPDDRDERAFYVEPFCAILSEVSVGGPDPKDFLAAAVPFVNDRVWGTLSASIFVHPTHEKDPDVALLVDDAIAEMRYGAVAVNHWSALAYAFGTTPWGAAPGATPEDIQSGTGWVHNTLLLEGIHKTVIRGPILIKPKPPWFPGHRTAHHVARKMLHFEADPRWRRLPGLVWTAIRG